MEKRGVIDEENTPHEEHKKDADLEQHFSKEAAETVLEHTKKNANPRAHND